MCASSIAKRQSQRNTALEKRTGAYKHREKRPDLLENAQISAEERKWAETFIAREKNRMTHKERLEQIEFEELSEFAAKSKQTKGKKNLSQKIHCVRSFKEIEIESCTVKVLEGCNLKHRCFYLPKGIITERV